MTPEEKRLVRLWAPPRNRADLVFVLACNAAVPVGIVIGWWISR